MSALDSVLQDLARDIDHLIATYVVDIDSGMPLSGVSNEPNLDEIAASASYAQVVKANASALRFLGIDPTTTEDIVITTRDFYVLIRYLGAEQFHGVTMGKQASLGLTRNTMARYASRLVAALPR